MKNECERKTNMQKVISRIKICIDMYLYVRVGDMSHMYNVLKLKRQKLVSIHFYMHYIMADSQSQKTSKALLSVII